MRMENELKKSQEREKLQVRTMGKLIRHLETDTIKRFLESNPIIPH